MMVVSMSVEVFSSVVSKIDHINVFYKKTGVFYQHKPNWISPWDSHDEVSWSLINSYSFHDFLCCDWCRCYHGACCGRYGQRPRWTKRCCWQRLRCRGLKIELECELKRLEVHQQTNNYSTNCQHGNKKEYFPFFIFFFRIIELIVILLVWTWADLQM